MTLIGSPPSATSPIIQPGDCAAISLKLCVRSRQYKRSSFEMNWLGQTATMRSGSGKGSGRISTPRTTEKTAAFAPDPSASSAMATAANPGRRKMLRKARDRSGKRMAVRRGTVEGG